MVVERVTETKQIARVLTHENQGNIVTLYTALGSASHYVRGESLSFDVHLNSTINCLHAITEIQSLQATQLPQSSFSGLNEGVNLRLAGLLPDTPRKRIEVLFRDFNGEWEHLAWCDTVRSNFYPSISFDLRALISPRGLVPMAEGSEIGVRVVNIGNGFLQGDDRVTFWGAVTEETTLVSFDSTSETVTSVVEAPSTPPYFIGEGRYIPERGYGKIRLLGGYYWHIIQSGQTVGKSGTGASIASDAAKEYYKVLWDDDTNYLFSGERTNADEDFDAGKRLILGGSIAADSVGFFTGIQEGELD